MPRNPRSNGSNICPPNQEQTKQTKTKGQTVKHREGGARTKKDQGDGEDEDKDADKSQPKML